MLFAVCCVFISFRFGRLVYFLHVFCLLLNAFSCCVCCFLLPNSCLLLGSFCNDFASNDHRLRGFAFLLPFNESFSSSFSFLLGCSMQHNCSQSSIFLVLEETYPLDFRFGDDGVSVHEHLEHVD